MATCRFPWRFFFILICLTGAFVAYDVHLHGSFKKSRTGKMLKEVGVLKVYEQSQERVIAFSQNSYKWLEKNAPIYYAKTCNCCRFYLELFWEKFFLCCGYLWDNTKDIREWLTAKVPPILDWVSEHFSFYMENVSFCLAEVWKVLHQRFVWLSGHVLRYLNIAGIWLQQNVFTGNLSPENLQRYAVMALETIQQYSMSVLHWCSQQLSYIIYSK